MNGTIMRVPTIAVFLSAWILPTPVFAQQSPGSQFPSATTAPKAIPDDSLAEQNFTSVAIVALEDLPSQIRPQVEAVVNQTTHEELYVLQSSVDAWPPVAAALAANGLNSSQVVAANIDDDGTLTLIVQTTT
ncbi:hypothetical protein [Mesorhizobium sp. A623]